MGYTHYWDIDTTKLEPRHFFALAADVPAIFAAAKDRGIDVVRESRRPSEPPRLAGGIIVFNGPGDLGYETFCLDLSPHRPPTIPRPASRDADERAWFDWYEYDRCAADSGTRSAFCKTARQPYDAVVCAVLIRTKHHLGDVIDIGSDGEFANEEWREGRALYTVVFGIDPASPMTPE